MGHISEIKVFTDGSFVNNTKECGYGVVFPNKEYPNISKPFTFGHKTNQRAELYAIYKGIKTVYKDLKENNTVNQKVNIIIYTDSEYSIKSLTIWIMKWKNNNWKTANGKDVLNQDIIIKLDTLIEKYKKFGIIKFIHVRSHTGHNNFESINNDLADNLAKKGGKIVNSK